MIGRAGGGLAWMTMPTLRAGDGVDLHLRAWEPSGTERGTVVLVHGLGEHIGRYEHVAAALTDEGWRVFGHDHRGHGRSGGGHGRLATSDDFLQDLATVVDHARRPGRPLVLLGHSLGGAIAGRFVAEGIETEPAAWHRPVDALVMTSPALELGMNPAQKALLAVLGPVAPTLAVGNGLKAEWISRDPAVVKAYEDDPLVHDRVTARLVRFMLDAGQVVRARASSWTVPTLLLWAGADRVIAAKGSAAFAAAAPREVVRSKEYPGWYHEILNEPEQVEVLDEIRRWLAERPGP